jgi:uncharacterized protein (TIGR02271 family)
MINSGQLQSLAGNSVKSRTGEKIGKVVDVYESTDGDTGTFISVSTGLFGGGASFVPLQDAQLDGNDVVVPYDKDLVKDAPRVEADQDLSAAEEDRLYAHYSLTQAAAGPPTTAAGDSGRARGAGHDTSGPNTDDAMTRSEQRLVVGTEAAQVGRARLRKRIVTETETRTVPVSHEEVRIEREPITETNVGDAMRGGELTEEEHEVVLHEERPVVAKETVPVERVRLGTETVTEERTVNADVSKEVIETEGVDDKRR